MTHSFPTRRSSDLLCDICGRDKFLAWCSELRFAAGKLCHRQASRIPPRQVKEGARGNGKANKNEKKDVLEHGALTMPLRIGVQGKPHLFGTIDRKINRLNSSH